MKNVNRYDKGITMVTLIVIIIVLLILASVATYSGINTINSSKLTTFTTEMKIMQTQVNSLYQKYKNDEIIQLGEGEAYKGEEILEMRKSETDVTNSSLSCYAQANAVLENELHITDKTGYLYFNKKLIEDLGIEGVKQEFFVNIKTRSVVSYKGLNYEGQMYYTLDQLPRGLYNVEYKEETGKPTFSTKSEKISSDKWRVSISDIKYEGYIDKWQVKYQIDGANYWSTSEEMSFVVNSEGIYKVKIVNGSIESQEQNVYITQEYAKDGLVLYLDGINNIGQGNSKHDENTTIWKDLSGNGNDATLKNIVQSETGSGWNENCLQLDGINDYAVIPNSETMKPTAQTIEIVFNRTGEAPDAGEKRAIIFVRWPGYTVELNEMDTSNKFTLSYGRNTSGYLNSTRKVKLNNIYHFAGTNNGNKSKMYINSVFDSEQDVVPINYSGMNETNIGQYSNYTHVKGNIYAIRMYNRELTEEEIDKNYQIDKLRYGISDWTTDDYDKNGLILHYDAINNTGEGDDKHSSDTTIWKDLSGNGNDGTLNGFNMTQASGWRDNNLIFDGEDDWISLNNIIKGKTEFTVEYVSKQKRLKSWEYLWGLKANNFGLESGVSNYRHLYYGEGNKSSPLNDIKGDINTIIHNTVSVNSTNINGYLDGNKLLTNKVLYPVYTEGEKFGIGADGEGNYKMQIDYYIFRIYDRILTDNEVKSNYKLDKERFKLK